MPWVKLDDHFDEHPKFARVGPVGLALFVTSLAYSNRNLTDGFIPRAVARNLLDYFIPDASGVHWTISAGEPVEAEGASLTVCDSGSLGAEDIIPHLVNAGLWEVVPGGYRIHDYHEYQPSREEVLALTEARKNAGKKGAESRWHGRDGKSHGKSHPDGKCHGKSYGKTDGKSIANLCPEPEPVPEPVIENSARSSSTRLGARVLGSGVYTPPALDALRRAAQAQRDARRGVA